MNISTAPSCKARHVADSRTIIHIYRSILLQTFCYIILGHEYNPVNVPILIFLRQLKKELVRVACSVNQTVPSLKGTFVIKFIRPYELISEYVNWLLSFVRIVSSIIFKTSSLGNNIPTLLFQ